MRSQKRWQTLFRKILLMFIVVTAILFVLAGILMSQFMVSYSVNENVKQMTQAADLISDTIEIYRREEEGTNTYWITGIDKYATSYYELTGSYVYIVDVEGRIRVSAPNVSEHAIRENLKYEADGYYFSDPLQYRFALEAGETLVEHGDYYGLYQGTGTRWITIAKRLETLDDEGNVLPYGVVIISRPDMTVYLSRTSVIRYFMISGCVSLAVAILLTTFLTKRLMEPIESLKAGANAVSRGDFYGTIEYDGEDDMGDLIHSFNSMTRSLAALEKNKDDFIANVSHELRTPITTIRGFIEGMLDGTIPQERWEHYLAIVRDEVNRMNQLVNDQLQLARLQKGGSQVKKATFDINEMLRQELIKNEKNIEEKHFEIVVEFEEEKQNVFAEEESIRRVVINLINNAIKFTPDGGTITLGTLRKKKLVEIYVMDTGVGIREGEEEAIFERYFKSDKSRGMDRTGTGLGLSICKGIVNAHQHDIVARNNENGPGAKFVFWLDAI